MKKLLALLLALVMVFALAACGGEGETTTTEPPADDTTTPDDVEGEGTGFIGISMPTQSLERWNRDGNFLKEQFEAAGYQAELVYSDNEVDQQVSDIQNLIAQGVDLLVISAIDGAALNTVMDEAAANGIEGHCLRPPHHERQRQLLRLLR